MPKSGIEFTLGVRVMGVSFDDADRSFTSTDPAGFQRNGPASVSTMIGSEAGAAVHSQGGTTMIYPGGFNISQSALPVPELTVGTVFGTRAVVRWFSADPGGPDHGKLELFGIGGQPSVSRYLKFLPADVAPGAFYQTFKLGDGLLDTKALHVDVTASRPFGRLIAVEPYVSVGYYTFSMDVSYKDSTDPTNHISLTMEKQANAHLAAGARFRSSSRSCRPRSVPPPTRALPSA